MTIKRVRDGATVYVYENEKLTTIINENYANSESFIRATTPKKRSSKKKSTKKK